METDSNYQKKTILMVGYAYPPAGNFLSSLRLVKFTKYLPKYGWEPLVLCASGAYESCEADSLPPAETVRAYDIVGTAARLGGVAMADRIYRKETTRLHGIAADSHDLSNTRRLRLGFPKTKSFLRRQRITLNRRLFVLLKEMLIPDHLIVWYPSAVITGSRTLRKRKVDAIYSTSPHFTNHLVAGRLAHRFKVPWVADFRDPWANSSLYPFGSWRRWIDTKIERWILRHASQVITVSEGWKAQLTKTAPDMADKIAVIPNGFDHTDLTGLSHDTPTDRFVLSYCGEFHGGKRNPKSLLQAIAELNDRGKINTENFKLVLIGGIEPQVVELVKRFGISHLVEFTNYLAHRKALARMAKSSFGLIITQTDEAAKGEMTTKFYEYLGMRLPILALTPKDFEMAQTIETMKLGMVIDPGDVKGIATWINVQVSRFETNGSTQEFELVDPMQFSREAGASSLAAYLNKFAS